MKTTLTKNGKKIGRPTVMTDSVVEKLKTAFQRGATVEQACGYAMIDKGTYYNEIKRNASFSTEMESAQEYSNLVAKTVVVDKIIKDKDDVNARWWLEKREYNKPAMQQNTQVNVQGNISDIEFVTDDPEDKITQGTV